ncbi:hypothetical protein V1460_35730 [Streptomyces sp. SCSIO 30461]|uniref:hypothetical protein n=1 Tax=Streptomyces sp. SCSIO 30461 TaxID=3118085 RepID=UPI0030D2D883
MLALLAAMLLMVATATSAQAHVVYERDEVWANTDSTKCLYTYAEVSHGGRGGYVKSEGLSSSGIPAAQACILVWNRPAGYLATGYRYWKWNGSQWTVCREYMSGIYNTTTTSRVTGSYNFGVVPPCGGGYYATTGYSGVLYGGQWLGKNVGVWSGQHFIEP